MRTKLTIPTITQSLSKIDLIIIYNISDPEVDDNQKSQGWSLNLVWVYPFRQNCRIIIFYSRRRATNLFCPNTIHENKYVDDQLLMVELSIVRLLALYFFIIMSYYIHFLDFTAHTHILYRILCCSKCYITQFTGKSSLYYLISNCKNFFIYLFEFILTAM